MTKTIKVDSKNYDIGGIVTKVNEEANRVLVSLTKKVQEHEGQMWITVEEDTKILNKRLCLT
ncbi:hypothetical protein DFO73_102250 [Cytobacillus oceanisediminis]|uniref:Uncharacterized protein n=1 Tax=Cytobacillus oceanisediminis TaxID=665099 RepID=A0A2V3A490_9BACI|nr:hypothetical protein [Cytobacillus oceanisediminis]PWW31255.1 hypothetical protein DFO73_102250 [Cytobacillus oceanisediminis]